MDYKSVIEEQIRELQKVQDENKKLPDSTRVQAMCQTAMVIVSLITKAERL